MKLINKNTDYAVRAIMTLAGKRNSFMSAKEISEKQNIPYQFLRQVLRLLIGKGIIESKEGVGGGVKLVIAADKIRVSDLIRIYNKNFVISECMFRGKPCSNRKNCVLREEIIDIENDLISKFEKLTIQKLLKKSGR
jgi:Rrf2 family cysteine metabolism transcriptional repressor